MRISNRSARTSRSPSASSPRATVSSLHVSPTAIVVTRVSDRDDEELAYLEDAGITPGTELTIVDIAPFGMVTVRTPDGHEQSLPESVARSIRVEPVVEETA